MRLPALLIAFSVAIAATPIRAPAQEPQRPSVGSGINEFYGLQTDSLAGVVAHVVNDVCSKDIVATVGFTAHAGQSSMAGKPSAPIAEAPPGSLEAQATEGGVAWLYLNSAALRRMGSVPSRLFGRFATADWSNYFDGVVVIRDETAPTFEPIR